MSTSLARIDDLATWPEAYVRPSQLARYLGLSNEVQRLRALADGPEILLSDLSQEIRS